MTETKKLRVLDWTKERGVFRKDNPDPPEPRRHIGDCHICGLPVYVSKGQIINIGMQQNSNGEIRRVYAHKRCRKV